MPDYPCSFDTALINHIHTFHLVSDAHVLQFNARMVLLLVQLQHYVRDFDILISRVFCRDLEDDVLLMIGYLHFRDGLDELAEPEERESSASARKNQA